MKYLRAQSIEQALSAVAAAAESGHAFSKEERELLARAIEAIQEVLEREGKS